MEKKVTKGNSIIGGTVSLTLSTLIVKILGLIYKIPLANILGDEGMGVFNSAYTVYAFFYLLCTAGVPKAVMILVSEARAKGKEADENMIIKTALNLFFSIGAACCVLFVVFAKPLARLVGNSAAWATMIAVAPSIVFISLAGVIRGYLNAGMRFLDVAVSQIIEGVGKLAIGLIAGIAALKCGFSLELVSAMTITGVSFGSFIGLIYLVMISKIRITKEKVGQKRFRRKILSISIPITISAAIMSLTGIIDLGLIMRNLSFIGYSEAEASALYGNYTTLAMPMFNFAISIITPISLAFLPTFTKAIVSFDKEEFEKIESDSLNLSSFVSAPLVAGLAIYSSEILNLLFPTSDIAIGSLLLCLLLPAIVFSSMLLITNTALEAGGRVKAPLVSMSLGCLAKITVSLLLIRNSSFGISGAPIGTVCCYAVALLVSSFVYRIHFKSSLPLFSTCIPFYLFAFAASIVSRTGYLLMNEKYGEVMSLGIAIIFCAVLYFVLSILFYLTKYKGKVKIAKYTKLLNKNC